MMAIGFDSGEVQFYTGLRPSLEEKPEVGPGFRISEKGSVSLLRYFDRFNPFANASSHPVRYITIISYTRYMYSSVYCL